MATAHRWGAPERAVVREAGSVALRSPPLVAADWVLSGVGPVNGAWVVLATSGAIGSRLVAGFLACLVWFAAGHGLVRARVRLTRSGVEVRRYFRTRNLRWDELVGFRWRPKLVSRQPSRALEVVLTTGEHVGCEISLLRPAVRMRSSRISTAS